MALFLQREVTSVAFCWRVQRRDGVALGFTSHDRDLLVDGLTYRAAPGMAPSAITLSAGFDAAALDIAGALSDDAITEADLLAGRWDGARVGLFMLDWEHPQGERVMLARGELGDVALEGTGFTVELKGPAAALDRPVVEQTSPECRAELGDGRCRVDLAGLARVTRITALHGERTIEVAERGGTGNAYAYGRLRWLSGPNSGLEGQLLSSDDGRLTLREPPRFPVAVGELVEIVEGCDRAFATCRGRFGNGLNFRGEPHLPGMDLLTRYEMG